MNDELKIRLTQLKELQELINKKQEYSKLLMSEEKYLSAHLKRTKPKLKNCKVLDKPPKKYNRFILILGLGVLFLVLGFGFISAADFGIGAFMVIASMFIAFVAAWSYKIAKNKYQNSIVEYSNSVKCNAEAEIYNNKVYPIELEEYNKELVEWKKQYKVQIEKVKPDYQEICAEIQKRNDVLHQKYHNDIGGIIEFIESGRADSFKEALNGYIKEKNDIAYKQYQLDLQAEKLEAEISHNQAMQRAAQEQADYVHRQVEIMKEDQRKRAMSAPDCLLCANYPCGGKPEYCGSFRQKS